MDKEYNSLLKYALFRGFNKEEAEDFRSWAYIKVLERKKGKFTSPTKQQLMVDYFRKYYGDSRTSVFLDRNNIAKARHMDEYKYPDHSLCEMKTKKPIITFDELGGVCRVVMFLKYRYGWESKKIAELLGVSASRICQIDKKIINRCRKQKKVEDEKTNY